MPRLTEKELKRLTELLQQLEPGYLPFDVFVQIARLVVLPIIEFVPLRYNRGQVEVLLLERSPDDPIWPSMLHTPGTVIRATDTDSKMYLAFQRVLTDELQETEVAGPQYVGSILHKSARGAEHAQVYWVEVIGPPKVGHFFPIKELPENLIQSQLKFIQEAAKHYQKTL